MQSRLVRDNRERYRVSVACLSRRQESSRKSQGMSIIWFYRNERRASPTGDQGKGRNSQKTVAYFRRPAETVHARLGTGPFEVLFDCLDPSPVSLAAFSRGPPSTSSFPRKLQLLGRAKIWRRTTTHTPRAKTAALISTLRSTATSAPPCSASCMSPGASSRTT